MRLNSTGRVAAVLASMGLGLAVCQPAQAAETKSFVVSWLNTAMNNEPGDCPGGQNPTLDGLFKKIAAAQGVPQAEIDKMIEDGSPSC